jgi:hypothetical protein
VVNKVADHIDPSTSLWDEELIREIFWEEDVKHILTIPIKPGREDTLAWHFDDGGLFSVKSAYHVLDDARSSQQQKQVGASSSGNPAATDFQWLQIWRLPYCPKVKQFKWRLAHNSLPFRLNIRRRGVDSDTRCPVCWRLDEDGGRCFLICKWVKHCWQTLNLEEARIQLSSLGSVPQVVNNILDRKEEERTLIVHFLEKGLKPGLYIPWRMYTTNKSSITTTVTQTANPIQTLTSSTTATTHFEIKGANSAPASRTP